MSINVSAHRFLCLSPSCLLLHLLGHFRQISLTGRSHARDKPCPRRARGASHTQEGTAAEKHNSANYRQGGLLWEGLTTEETEAEAFFGVESVSKSSLVPLGTAVTRDALGQQEA